MEIFILCLLLIICILVAAKILDRLPNSITKHLASFHRNSPLDGLRGILALMVLSHHFIITYFWINTGIWDNPPSRIADNFGAIGVSFFFLITGYLFLNRIKSQEIKWDKLYLSRIKRIFPLYLGVMFVIFIISISLVEQPYTVKAVIFWLYHWLTFDGVFFLDFHSPMVISGVQWTLLYEWKFYLLLPLLHIFLHRRIHFHWSLLLSFAALASIIYQPDIYYLLFALSGVAIYYSDKAEWVIKKWGNLLNIFILVLLLFVLVWSQGFSLNQMLILAIIFFFIANGYDFNGILMNKGLKILGEISYSIYLLHGLVLYCLLTLFPIVNVKEISLMLFIAYFPLIFFVTILISSLSYCLIEYPFIRKI